MAFWHYVGFRLSRNYPTLLVNLLYVRDGGRSTPDILSLADKNTFRLALDLRSKYAALLNYDYTIYILWLMIATAPF
jgi:hypothetical protein